MIRNFVSVGSNCFTSCEIEELILKVTLRDDSFMPNNVIPNMYVKLSQLIPAV